MVVVDTNILAYLLLEGDQTKHAQALFALDDDWRSDYFVLIEFTNVLATTVRARGLKPATAEALLGAAQELMADGLQFVAPTDALELAMGLGVSGYDARFLAMARALGTRLVTEDAKLRQAAPMLTVSLAEALA